MTDAVLERIERHIRLQSYFAFAAIPVLIGAVLLGVWAFIRTPSKPTGYGWSDAGAQVDLGNFLEAQEIAEGLLERNPDYYYAHWYVGWLELSQGRPAQSVPHFQRAFDLYPTEENAEALEAARKAAEQR